MHNAVFKDDISKESFNTNFHVIEPLIEWHEGNFQDNILSPAKRFQDQNSLASLEPLLDVYISYVSCLYFNSVVFF